jgi:uncharacterized protein YkwD
LPSVTFILTRPPPTIIHFLGLLMFAAALGCTPRPAPAAFGSGLGRVAAKPGVEKQEREMFLRLNRDRKERGLSPLSYDARLAEVGRFHSADMQRHGFFEHDSPTSGSLEDRLNAAGYLFLAARENLSIAPDVQTSQDGLLKSPGHFANIVATDITHVGIGIVAGASPAGESLTITQVFSHPSRAESPAAARKAFMQKIQAGRASRGLKKAELHPLLDRLAARHIEELDAETSPSSLRAVGEQVSAEISEDAGLSGVSVGGQLLPDSQGIQLPEPLLESAKARFGLAVRTVPNASGRPMLQVLLLVGR